MRAIAARVAAHVRAAAPMATTLHVDWRTEHGDRQQREKEPMESHPEGAYEVARVGAAGANSFNMYRHIRHPPGSRRHTTR